MRSRCFPMTVREFELLPREIGWRYEYANGCAQIRPGHLAVKLTVPITPRPVADLGCLIRAVTLADSPCLARAFVDGFGDTVEYCDRTNWEVRRAAQDALWTFYSGKRGRFHSASCLAVSPTHAGRILGAALIVQKPDGPFLDMLYVRRHWQHSGLGTALASTVMNALLIAEETNLGSAYNVANKPSIAWHRRFGFMEAPEPALERLRLDLARRALLRREQLGGLAAAERQELEMEIQRCQQALIGAVRAQPRPGAAG
jgi:GNAT superfamily N-acetyltransferase